MIYEQEEIEENTKKSKKQARFSKSKSFKNIVVGGGLTGLLTTLFLALKREKTLLIEKNNYIGGYISTTIINHEGQDYTFDNWMPLDLSNDSYAYSILNSLEITKTVNIFKTRTLFVFQNDKERIAFPNDWRMINSILKRKHPLVSKELDDFFILLKGVRVDYKFKNDLMETYKNAEAFLLNFFRRDITIRWFFELFWPFFGTSFSLLETQSFLYNLAHYLIGGFHYIKGHSQNLIKCLEEKIIDDFGVIHLNTELTKIKNSSDNVSLITVTKSEVQSKRDMTYKASKYLLSSSIKDALPLFKNQDPSLKEYEEVLKQQEQTISEILVRVCVSKNLGIYNINEPMYILNPGLLHETSDKVINNIKKWGYKASPLYLYNQNSIYSDSPVKTGAFLVKLYDSQLNADNQNKQEIKQYVEQYLENVFPLLKKQIVHCNIETTKESGQRLGRKDCAIHGLAPTAAFGWKNRSFETIYKNMLISSVDGFPGMRGNSLFLTVSFVTSAIDLGLKKTQDYSNIDHLNAREILFFMVKNYKPHPKYLNKTIGFTLDEKYSFQVHLGVKEATLKELEFERALESNYFVWTFSTTMKDILTGRSKVMLRVFANKMRVKGGAFFFAKLLKRSFSAAKTEAYKKEEGPTNEGIQI